MFGAPGSDGIAGWVLLISDRNAVRLMFLQGKLETEGVTTQLLNQQDSMYPSVGESHLYVRAEDLERAQRIMGTNS